MYISDDIKYVGVNDKTIDLFEGQYPCKNGVSYNSYLINDDKTCLIDTVDIRCIDEFLNNLDKELNGKELDYIVVEHMESDHSGSLFNILNKYPNAKVIGNVKTFNFINQFFDVDIKERQIIVNENDKLNLGKHELTFIMAPMVHWPEVMMVYESFEKILFSADAFGKFSTLDTQEEWLDEARRYYINIVGKYGAMVKQLFTKISNLDIKTIAPLHGPILNDNLSYYINLYDTWSSFNPEEKGVLIAYASIYGNTKNVAYMIKEKIENNSSLKVEIVDLAREDLSKCVSYAFKYDRMILCSSTYDGGAFTPMEDFLHHLSLKTYQNRTVGLVENGTWGPIANKAMKAYLDNMKNIKVLDQTVTIKSAYKKENEEAIDNLVNEIINL